MFVSAIIVSIIAAALLVPIYRGARDMACRENKHPYDQRIDTTTGIVTCSNCRAERPCE